MARAKGEAFWWSLFSAGGGLAAILVPVHILLIGLVVPLGWVSAETLRYERVHALVSHPLAKLYLLVFFALSFFHCAHRIRHTLYDTGWRAYQTPIAVLCYGGALLGTLVAIAIIFPI